MTVPIVECIPNFSEARRQDVIDAIIEAIKAVSGVHLLDKHSDMDHNRTVLTFVGSPQDVEEAAFEAIAKAAELINLDEHSGEHPRIGATDVVPFVPISGIRMQDCVEMAKRVGRRVGDELRIPVYLYEEAATRPERRDLENIRRGQYEGLKGDITTKPERRPDFGPSRVGPAGATVIGARHPLIAFNVYLATQDVEIAKKVAKAVRHSSGGLRYVKALGMLVDGQAQVSMNLTNFRGTPIGRVVEMVRREAGRYGVSVHHSELVGLIPQEALVDAAQWYMQLDQFEPDQILEYRMAAAQQTAPAPETAAVLPEAFLEALAASTPVPGGGSASAYSGAAGAALVSMVARLTMSKKRYEDVEEQMRMVLEQAERLRIDLTNAIQDDADAFTAVLESYMLPKSTKEEQEARQQAINEATLDAARIPLEVANKAIEVLELALQVVTHGNINAISDGATGAALARAALTGAGCNVRINIAGIPTHSDAKPMLKKLREIEKRAGQLEAQIQAVFTERGGVPKA